MFLGEEDAFCYIRPGLLEMDLEIRICVHVTYLVTCSQRRQVRNKEAEQPKESLSRDKISGQVLASTFRGTPALQLSKYPGKFLAAWYRQVEAEPHRNWGWRTQKFNKRDLRTFGQSIK